MVSGPSPRCPQCASRVVRLIFPETPEALTYRCADCRHVWSEDLSWLQLRAPVVPRKTAPIDGDSNE